MGNLRWIGILALLGSWAVFGWIYLRMRTEIQVQKDKAAALSEQDRQRGGLIDEGRRDGMLPARESQSAAPTALPAAALPGSAKQDDFARQELVRLVDAKNAHLESAKAAVSDLQAKVQEMDARISALTQETTRLSEVEKDLRDKFDTASRLTDALQTEIKGNAARSTQLQTANRDLLRRSEEASRKLSRLMKTSEEMEDLSRRRETYIISLLRRYRELTDFYRTQIIRVDHPQETAIPSNSDLSRVQSVIALADEDLRQLRSINVQVSRLQKEFSDSRAEAAKH
ncbi:MAG: hypothetical protein JJE04_04565 [Acidobacteriia bacterium]|nr:hypothetical protein [Terriglobia bacterium]